MIYPEFLKDGQTIAVPAPSAGIAVDEILTLKNAINNFEKLGHKINLTKNFNNTNLHISSSNLNRSNEFTSMWKDENNSALISLAGGEFMVQILPYLNRYEIINSKAKWFQGFSDNTCLTYFLTVLCDIASIYHYNFLYFGMKSWHSSVKDSYNFLTGKKLEFSNFSKVQNTTRKIVKGSELEGFNLNTKNKWVNLLNDVDATFSGRLIGGCLDVLVCLCGTGFDYTKEFIKKYYNDGFIWYLETYDLNTPETLRALWQLKMAGWFENVKGFIIGRPTVNENFKSWTYEKAVKDQLLEFNVPILFNCDVGHIPPTIPMVNGAITHVNYTKNKATISFELK